MAAAQTAFAVLAIVVANGCSVGAPSTVSLNTASVDATHICPAGADNAPYDLHATIDVSNGTPAGVTIKSVDAAMTLAAVRGSWLQRVGDKYEAREVGFAPATVGAGSSTSLKIIIPSACTGGRTPSLPSGSSDARTAGASYGDYAVAFVVTASSGTYTIQSKNRHRIVAA